MSIKPKPAPDRRNQTRKTLGCFAELAVILVVLGILVPMGQQVFNLARDTARWSNNEENAKIIGFALAMYSDDHDSNLPLAANWATALQPSVDELLEYWYQSDLKRVKQRKLDGAGTYTATKSHFDIVKWSRDPFAMNRAMSGINVKKIKHPEQTVVFFETTERKPNPSGEQSIQLPPYGERKWSVYVMADGKVKVTEYAKDGSGRLVDWHGKPVTIRWKP